MKALEDLAAAVSTQLHLQYDASAVKFIEGFIERNKGSLDEKGREGLINSLGAFLGQCIIENHGGQWERDKDTGSVAVAFDDDNKAYPFGKVSKQVANGLEDSVYTFYTVIPVVFRLPKKKKPWWKF